MTDIYRGVVQGATNIDGEPREVVIWRSAASHPPYVPRVHVSFLATEKSTVVFDLPTLLSFVMMLSDAGSANE